MTNAKTELLKHIGDRKVKYISIIHEIDDDKEVMIAGSLQDVIELLDFDYQSGYGRQYVFGNIWYEDGTWSDRYEYDGLEWWKHRVCPEIPNRGEKR